MIRLIIALCGYLFLQGAVAATATIATAANFKTTMDELIVHFQQHYPHQLRQINASSGVLFNQINHGAPFDVFLAANSHYPMVLADQGSAIEASRFTYAEGKLALVATKPLATDPLIIVSTLTEAFANGDKVAIANPDTAPYGIAARQVLNHLQLWHDHQSQLVRGNNVGQGFQFVATGNTPLGFVALSQLNMAPALNYWLVPEHWYQPILQQAILLQSGKDNPAAVAFLDFLKTSEAKAIIHRHGYASHR